MEYYFQDNLRWSLGWETPNQAGAFLATLLPLCWILSVGLWGIIQVKTQARAVRLTMVVVILAVVVGEGWLWWALAKTYSRGAWAGVACGAFVRGLGMVCAKSARFYVGRLTVLATMLRIVAVVACLFASNFSARLAPDYTRSDRSALNRLDLWKGGLELVAASPLRGWGWGESGAAYMQWTQPLDRTEAYKSMVNSYLTVAVEAGLPVFALLLTGVLTPLVLGVWLVRGGSGGRLTLAVGLSACWAIWLGCLFFSNLWIIFKLWIVPGASAVVIVAWSAAKAGRALRARRDQPVPQAFASEREAVTPYLGAGAATAFVLALGAWITGLFLTRSTPLELTREPSGIVRLGPRGKPSGDWLEVYPDTAVLGKTYGHELRRWLLVAAHPSVLRIQSPLAPVSLRSEGHSAVIFGEQVIRASLANKPVCLVHPFGISPSDISSLAAGSRVVLAGIDPTGGRYSWETWALERGADVLVNEGLATDVRLRWPAIIEGFARP